jgi:hypothetical protein
MIRRINYRRLWVSEFIQFLKDVISICTLSDPVRLNINSRLKPLEESVKELDAVFKKERGSDLTDEVATLDDRRDKAFLCLSMMIKAYGYHFDEAKLAAAEKIDALLDRYGTSIHKLNYQAETTTVSNLVNDLESDAELSVAVSTLELQPLVDELKTSNRLFHEKYIARAREVSQASEDSAVELRKTAIVQYLSLVDLIEAYVEISGPDNYQELIKHLNEVIEKYNGTIAFRTRDEETEEEGEVS